MGRCNLPGRATFVFVAIIVQIIEGAEGRFTNDSRYHLDAQPSPPIVPATIQQTTTVTGHPDRSSATAFEKATSTDHAFPGCSTDCTYDESPVTQNRNSWTKCQDTVMIGRVHYIVDKANNKTSTSTDYAQRVTFTSNGKEVTSDVTDILGSGSHILTRTDVNAAGTVTYMDGTNTMAYPTGFNVLPSFYVWNGTLPYTSGGSTLCASANDDTTTLLRHTLTYTQNVSSVLSLTTFSYTKSWVGATPLPSVENLPTQSVYALDKQDPKGWTYCYDFGEDVSLGDNFYSLFSGDLFDQVRQNCSVRGGRVSPLVVVDAAAFLLDETTSYVDSSKTGDTDNLRSRPTESSQISTDVQVDPFQQTSEPGSPQKSSSTDDTNSIPSTATKLAQSELPETASQSKTSEPGNDPQPIQTTRPTLQPESSSIHTQASTGIAPENGDLDSATPQGPATRLPSTAEEHSAPTKAQNSETDSKAQPGSEPSAHTQTIASSSGVQIDTLNSLIQDLGQLQSSGNQEAVESITDASIQDKPSAIVDVTTTLQPKPIAVESTTITANSDGNYMVGTHQLQPTDSPYELEGTTYSLDTSKSALVINDKSTYAMQSSQPADDISQAVTLTLIGVTMTPNSASEYIVETQTLKPGGPAITVSGTQISLVSDLTAVVVGSQTSALSTTTGIGDYVWAGLAGMLSAASMSASSLSTSPETSIFESSRSLSTSTGSPLPIVTRTASDGETVVGDSFSRLSAATDPSSTSGSATDHISAEQDSTPSTNPGTTSQPGPSLSSSSSSSTSSIDETSSESDSDRVIVSATFAICILSLVFTIFA